MWYQLITTAILAGAFQYYLKMRVWLDWDKPFLYRHAPGQCTQVLKEGGSEDLTHIGDGIILLSTGFGIGTCCGKIMMLDINKSPTAHELNITNPPTTPDFMASPHGISTWKDPKTGQLTLFVITHPPDEDRIEVFELQKPASLRHIRTITDRKFRNMNDLVAVDKDRFYITQWLYARDLLKSYFELFLFQYFGKVFFYDGRKAREVASDLFVSNGINISPDKSTIYVAEFSRKRLLGYQRKPNDDLTIIWEHDMGTSVDNIEVDPTTGDLWIGCHPLGYAIMDFFDIFGFPRPSQALKVKMRQNMVDEIVEVYADPDGSEAYGSTVATYVDGKVIIGTVQHQLVVCDSKYIA